MKTIKLGEVCKIINGGTPKTVIKEYWDGDILFMTPKDLGKIKIEFADKTERKITQAGLDNSSAKLLPTNSIILSTRAPIGYVVINSLPMSFNQGCRGIIPSDKIDVGYLYHFLKMNTKLLNDLGTGTTFKELSTVALSDITLGLPSIDEQRKIVAKLDKSLSKISKAEELLKKNIVNVAELQKSILAEAFRFDDALTERERERERERI